MLGFVESFGKEMSLPLDLTWGGDKRGTAEVCWVENMPACKANPKEIGLKCAMRLKPTHFELLPKHLNTYV